MSGSKIFHSYGLSYAPPQEADRKISHMEAILPSLSSASCSPSYRSHHKVRDVSTTTSLIGSGEMGEILFLMKKERYRPQPPYLIKRDSSDFIRGETQSGRLMHCVTFLRHQEEMRSSYCLLTFTRSRRICSVPCQSVGCEEKTVCVQIEAAGEHTVAVARISSQAWAAFKLPLKAIICGRVEFLMDFLSAFDSSGSPLG